MAKTAVLYARISVTSDESVSVARQLDSGRKYAEARGWQVAAVFVDDGVSATRNRPEERSGWQALLGEARWFDAVVMWKVDRLARRVMDFLNADQALQARGAAIVCVEQAIDMTTGEGRAFAQMLAVFGELESAATSARLTAARAHLLSVGRYPGGSLPFGYRRAVNAGGPGFVVEKDPERSEWLQQMARRAIDGENVNSIRRWLDSEGAPYPAGARWRRGPDRGWGYTAIERILRNPMLAGMVLHNPGQDRGGPAREVLRHEDGSPVIRPDLAVISLAEREQLLHRLDHKTHHTAIGRAQRVTTPRTLAGLAWCGHCDRLMHRATAYRRPILKCPRCTQQIAMTVLMPYLARRLLEERGTQPMYALAYLEGDRATGGSPAIRKLATIELALEETATALTLDGADVPALTKQLAELKLARIQARKAAGVLRADVRVPAGCTVAEVWTHSTTDEQQRELLAGQIDRLVIRRGRHGGRYLDTTRIHLTWHAESQGVVPNGIRLGDRLAPTRVAQPPEWISIAEAVHLTGLTDTRIRNATRLGTIRRRQAGRGVPSLDRASVVTYASALRLLDSIT